MEYNSVGKTSVPGAHWSSGVAYIAIPSDIDRTIYIDQCYKSGRVSVWTEDGGFINRVPIDVEVLNYIEFPQIIEQLGTAVVYVTEPVHQQPVIIARLPKSDEVGELKENQFKIKRKLGNKIVEVSGTPNALNLVVNSGEEVGSININLISFNSDSQFNIDIAGDVSVEVSGEVEFIQRKKFIVNTIGDDDKDINSTFEQTNEEHKFNSNKFIINEGDEPFLLGQKTIDFLEKFIDKVGAIQTVTQLGLQPIVNKADILLLKKELKTLISKEAFLNK